MAISSYFGQIGESNYASDVKELHSYYQALLNYAKSLERNFYKNTDGYA